MGYALPERLKEFYLQYNGGSTKQTASINKYQEVEIEDFFPFKYNKDFKNDPRYTAEGETLEQYLSGKIFGGETGTVMEPDPAMWQDLMLILKTIKRHWKQKRQR